ncbi:hypothetical protein [Sphingomonas sp. LR61]|uniref:SLAC1 family transporter n=1 Tax=Sphingomonas sp. LR61 TaxID=3050234 RepID=UPI003FA6F36A
MPHHGVHPPREQARLRVRRLADADRPADGGPAPPPVRSCCRTPPPGRRGRRWLWSCYGFFGLSLITSLVGITLIWNRLAQHKVGAAGMVPTLWIVLGPVMDSRSPR